MVATYSEDGGEGSFDVLNVLLRIRSELEKAGVIGERFVLQYPLEYIGTSPELLQALCLFPPLSLSGFYLFSEVRQAATVLFKREEGGVKDG